MKFAQYLDRSAVEEWRRAYINYRGLKKLIKRVAAHHRQRLEILAAIHSDDQAASSTNTATTTKPVAESLESLRERVLLVQATGSGGYGSTGHSGDLAAVPPPPHELTPILLEGTGVELSRTAKEKLQSGGILLSDRSGSAVRSGEGQTDSDDGDDEADRSGSQTQSQGRQGQTESASNAASRVATLGAGGTSQNAEAGPSTSSRNSPDKRGSHTSGLRHRRVSGHQNKKRKKVKASDLSYEEYITSLLDPSERIFFLALDSELERITDFYEERLSEAHTRFEQLVRQLRELAEHRRMYKESKDGTVAYAERFGWANPIPYVTNAANENIKRTYTRGNPPHQQRSTAGGPQGGDYDVESRADNHWRRAQVDSAATVIDEPKKVSSGSDDDEGGRRRSTALHRMEQELAADEREDERLAVHAHNEVRRQVNAATYDPVRYKAARHKLKEAIAEFYRGLELIKSYKVLNKDGYGKILKKFDKAMEMESSLLYFRAKLEPSVLVQSKRIDALLRSTEDAFAGFFEHGDRKKALDRLRLQGTTQNTLRTHHGSASRTGFYLGISLCGIVGGLVQAMKPDIEAQIPAWQGLLRVYGALFLPNFFAVLFGLNLAAFAYARMNTLFIFEWDPRHALDYHQYFEIPSFFFLLLSVCFWISFVDPFPGAIAPTSWPLIWLVIVLVIFLNPLPVFYFKSRLWFIKSIARVFGFGFITPGAVEFRDFFLGDELNSIAWSISTLWFIGCEYNRDWALPECNPNGTYWTAVLNSVPAFLRFGQCLRRWHDSGYQARLHLLNAIKYSTTFFLSFFYIHWRKGGSQHDGTLALWIYFACMYSSFTMTWDILMDWSLLHPNARYRFLRDDLVYESIWPVYYFAMVSNVILRCSWIIYLLPGPASTTLRSFIVALLEVLRRFQWNFFRVGNEHLGNVEQYRAIGDLKLPYYIPAAPETDDEDESGANTSDKKKSQGGAGGAGGTAAAEATGVAHQFGRGKRRVSMKMRDWKKKWNHSMMHYDVENGEPSSLPSGAGVQGPSVASEGGGGAVAGGDAAGNVPPSAHPQAKQPLSSSVPAESTGVLGLLHSFLIPDRGGYAARGPRIDDQGGVTGSLGRDYAPRRQEADAVEESDDEGDESDPESDERAHGHRNNPAGPRGSDRDGKQKRAKMLREQSARWSVAASLGAGTLPSTRDRGAPSTQPAVGAKTTAGEPSTSSVSAAAAAAAAAGGETQTGSDTAEESLSSASASPPSRGPGGGNNQSRTHDVPGGLEYERRSHHHGHGHGYRHRPQGQRDYMDLHGDMEGLNVDDENHEQSNTGGDDGQDSSRSPLPSQRNRQSQSQQQSQRQRQRSRREIDSDAAKGLSRSWQGGSGSGSGAGP